jgi:hypothetical protein
MLHYLRIAVTALSLTASVLLIALWLRSYWWHDTLWIRLTTNRISGMTSVAGSLGIGVGSNVFPEIADRRFLLIGRATDPFSPKPGWLDFRYIRHSDANMEVRVPHWITVLFATTLAAAPWLLYRFSLRTLLIATTLVAVVLGIVVAAM